VADQEFTGIQSVAVSQITHDLIGWQSATHSFALVRVLGVGDWQDDEQWLTSDQAKRKKPVFVLTDIWATPTGELADCLVELKKRNHSVTLVLISQPTLEARTDTQIRSWQFFAEQHKFELGLST
jgi:hypothetical protein